MIPAARSHLAVAAASHPGMSGKNNEDRFGVSAYRLRSDPLLPSMLAVVADGIGGHRAGEVAAELAVETISRIVAESDAAHPVKILRNAVIRAGQEISLTAEENPDLRGMGSTCACAWIVGDRLYTVSVGDSRIYLLRAGRILQLTIDHTWVQEAIDQGALKPEQARTHPNAHVIRRYLGSRQDVVPDLRLRLSPDESEDHSEANQGTRLVAGDVLLLCSDGLTDLVDDDEIMDVLDQANLETALDELVGLSNQRGGHDNITLIALRMPPAPSRTVVVKPEKTPRRWWLSCLSGAALLLVGLLIAAGSYWLVSRPSGVTATPTHFQELQINPVYPGTTAPAVLTPQTLLTPQVTAERLTPTAAFDNSQPGILPGGGPTLQPFTLTPWPTNTPGSP